MLKDYNTVNKRIGQNIVDFSLASNDGKIYIDDVLICIWEALVYLDVNALTHEQWLKKHIFLFRSVLTDKKILSRYRTYNRETLHEVLKQEQLSKYEDEGDLKLLFLHDIKLIEDVDESGFVTLNEKLFNSYISLSRLEWDFGIQSNKSVKKSIKSKVLLTSVKLSKEVEDLITPFVDLYCEDWNFDVEQERYKWDAVRNFSEKFNIESADIAMNIKDSMSPTANLLAGPFYYPLAMMVQMAECSPDEVRLMLCDLYNEDVSLFTRCENFLQEANRILLENKKLGNFKENDKSMQSIRAISVYLSLKYPAKHYLYKRSIYYDFRSITKAQLPSLSHFENDLVGYELFCEEVRKILLKNEKLISLHDATYPDDISNYHLLTQDFLFYVSYHYPERKGF